MRLRPEGVPGDRLAEQFEGVVVALLLQVHPSQLEQLVETPAVAAGLRSVAVAGEERDGGPPRSRRCVPGTRRNA